MACANERSPHPVELFGDDWLAWGEQQLAPGIPPTATSNPTDNTTRKAT
jgi:hypothetical protein